VKKLADLLPELDNIENFIFDIIGYTPDQNQVRPESPLAVASMDSLYSLAVGVLCQHGMPWHDARLAAEQYAQNTMVVFWDPDDRPTGDVAGVLQRLVEADIKVAVVASDDRSMTGDTLSFMGIEHLINILVCGDDDILNKPAPDAIWHISEKLGIPSDRMLMVGDTVSDMVFGKNEGVAGLAGIQIGEGKNSALAAHADVLIECIDRIAIGKEVK